MAKINDDLKSYNRIGKDNKSVIVRNVWLEYGPTEEILLMVGVSGREPTAVAAITNRELQVARSAVCDTLYLTVIGMPKTPTRA